MTGYPLLGVLRFLRGVVGETKRVCHIAAVPQRVPEADSLTAYCGIQIWRSQAEILTVLRGMPCEAWLLRVPTPLIGRGAGTAHTVGDVLGKPDKTPELLPGMGLAAADEGQVVVATEKRLQDQ